MKQKLSGLFKSKYPKLQPLWFGLFTDILGFYIIIPLLPSIKETFNTDDIMMGLLVSINAIISLFSAPIWGKLSDKFGRKYTLFTAESGTCLAFFILAFSNSLELLFISRIIDGMFGGNFPITKAIISDRVPPKDRGTQMTNFGVVHTLSGLIGPGLGGILAFIPIFGPNYPVALPGLCAAFLSLFTMVITLFYLEESWSKTTRLKIEEEIKFKKHRKKKNKNDILYVLTQYAFHTISFMLYVGPLALFAGTIIGLDQIGVIIILEISGLSRAIVRFSLFKPTMKKLGEKKMTKLGLFFLVLSFIFVGIFGLFYPKAWIFIILMVIISYGVSCSRGLLISKATKTVSPDKMGIINGGTTTLDSIAQTLGPTLGTFLYLINPLYYGFTMAIFASGALIMDFKNIVPLMEKKNDTNKN
ncbi:MAG: MFS transporter [Candidatus Lokiarchaeota archaeon]|nr:MFS transporter [Candidatus Lokiarchaeota archaeon]